MALPTNSLEAKATFSGLKALTTRSRWKWVALHSQAPGSCAVCGESDSKNLRHAADSLATEVRSPEKAGISASAASTIAHARGSIHSAAAPASGRSSVEMAALRK